VAKSAMPDLADHLTPGQVADLTAFLLSLREPIAAAGRTSAGAGTVAKGSTPTMTAATATAAATAATTAAATTTATAGTTAAAAATPDRGTGGPHVFAVNEQPDRLRIALDGQPVVDFVFRDDKIRRPYFANARLPDGRQVTRNHPPINGVDALDHDTMHPGIWLGFGDISQQDFWRNRAAMEHVRFVVAPRLEDGQLRFASECGLRSASGDSLGVVVHDCTLVKRPTGWMLAWRAAFRAGERPIVFGDQEEMGFGARVATPFIEKNGGVIRSSAGKTTAKDTWGQAAAWCDYSGGGPRGGGIMLMASGRNFRESWWHNRDYGVFVANPFGRAAMKQGDRSAVAVAPGESLRLEFGALVHDHRPVAGDAEFTAFEQLMTGQGPIGK
jgi:hypothetical protein